MVKMNKKFCCTANILVEKIDNDFTWHHSQLNHYVDSLPIQSIQKAVNVFYNAFNSLTLYVKLIYSDTFLSP